MDRRRGDDSRSRIRSTTASSATCRSSAPAETRRAIEAAEKAQKLWAQKTAKERAAILRKWFNLMMENQEDLARIMTAEQGKPLAESRGEIAYGASFIEFFAEEGKRIYGETIPSPWPTSRMVVDQAAARRRRGDHAVELPQRDDHPQGRARRSRPAAPSSASRPSETPLSALALAELGERAGIPAGVFSVITGSAREIGARDDRRTRSCAASPSPARPRSGAC